MGVPRKATAPVQKEIEIPIPLPRVKTPKSERVQKQKWISPRELEAKLYDLYHIPQSLNEKELKEVLKDIPFNITANEAYFLLRMKREYKMLDVYYTLMRDINGL